jgi:hypothetical protein
MAILVDFEKIREDKQEVEYAFGFPEMNRRMVIRKESQEGRPLDGKVDLLFRRAYAKIVRTQLDSGEWPEIGSYAA